MRIFRRLTKEERQIRANKILLASSIGVSPSGEETTPGALKKLRETVQKAKDEAPPD